MKLTKDYMNTGKYNTKFYFDIVQSYLKTYDIIYIERERKTKTLSEIHDNSHIGVGVASRSLKSYC